VIEYSPSDYLIVAMEEPEPSVELIFNTKKKAETHNASKPAVEVRNFVNNMNDYKVPRRGTEEAIAKSQQVPLTRLTAPRVALWVPPVFLEHSFPHSSVFLKAAIRLKDEVNLTSTAFSVLSPTRHSIKLISNFPITKIEIHKLVWNASFRNKEKSRSIQSLYSHCTNLCNSNRKFVNVKRTILHNTLTILCTHSTYYSTYISLCLSLSDHTTTVKATEFGTGLRFQNVEVLISLKFCHCHKYDHQYHLSTLPFPPIVRYMTTNKSPILAYLYMANPQPKISMGSKFEVPDQSSIVRFVNLDENPTFHSRLTRNAS